MKKLILISIVVLFVAIIGGCHGKDDSGKRMRLGTNVYVVTKDSCEYVLFDGSHNGGIVHKKNCRYCEQRKKK